jgi:hypothetical protein
MKARSGARSSSPAAHAPGDPGPDGVILSAEQLGGGHPRGSLRGPVGALNRAGKIVVDRRSWYGARSPYSLRRPRTDRRHPGERAAVPADRGLVGIGWSSLLGAGGNPRMAPLSPGQAGSSPRIPEPGIPERVGRVLKYWLAQWRHPRYMLAGVLHIIVFFGFLIPRRHPLDGAGGAGDRRRIQPAGLRTGPSASPTTSLKDYASTAVFVAVVILAIRRAASSAGPLRRPGALGKDHTPGGPARSGPDRPC